MNIQNKSIIKSCVARFDACSIHQTSIIARRKPHAV